jgi:hypothetical protein
VQCKGSRKLHFHGSYERNADCTGKEKAVTRCYRCPQCGATFSVIPRGMMPYRSLRVERLEAWMDRLHDPPPLAAGGDTRPPPASEVERGCLLRAQKRLLQRIPVLCGLLGQRMPLLARGDIGGFWRALRKMGRLVEILVHLAGNFNLSLLGDYGSLLPNWQREQATG